MAGEETLSEARETKTEAYVFARLAASDGLPAEALTVRRDVL